MIIYVAAIFCVIGLAVGQILFKVSAGFFTESGSFYAFKPLSVLFAAMCLYGITSLAWVWVLQRAELGRVYPLMALAFALVPIGSYFIFGERFHLQYFIGVAVIICGIVITMQT